MNIMCKNILVYNTNKFDELMSENNERKFVSDVKGDIDELIFPDDEPYYISER